MSIEAQLSDLKAAITENTAALNAILAAGTAHVATVVPITGTSRPMTAAAPAKKVAKTKEPEPTPEPEAEVPTKVAAPAPKETEFSDPLDKDIVVVTPGTPEPAKIDVEATIAACVETFKQKMLAADPARKAELKEQFPVLRAKWGLVADAKLASLSGTPEKLVGLLADIEAL